MKGLPENLPVTRVYQKLYERSPSTLPNFFRKLINLLLAQLEILKIFKLNSILGRNFICM